MSKFNLENDNGCGWLNQLPKRIGIKTLKPFKIDKNISKALKKISKIKTVQLVTPSIWAWRKGRLKNIKKYTDLTREWWAKNYWPH